MVTRLSGSVLGKGVTSNSITIMQYEHLIPYEMELESASPKKFHTTQLRQQGRSTEKPTRIESIRNILTCPVMTHIEKLREKHILHTRKADGGTGSKWCFPKPSHPLVGLVPKLPVQPLPAQASRAIEGLSAFPLCLCTIPSSPPSSKQDGHHGSTIPTSPIYHHCRLHCQCIG